MDLREHLPLPAMASQLRWKAVLLDLGSSARPRCPSGLTPVISARHATDDLAQMRFIHPFRRLRGRKPFDDAFLLFRPLFALTADFERKDSHGADDDRPILQALLIGERADGALGNGADDASLLECFTGREYCGDLPFFGQPFGITQRRVSREVMSMNCGREPSRHRYGKAPY
jgi:hypothetical protein